MEKIPVRITRSQKKILSQFSDQEIERQMITRKTMKPKTRFQKHFWAVLDKINPNIAKLISNEPIVPPAARIAQRRITYAGQLVTDAIDAVNPAALIRRRYTCNDNSSLHTPPADTCQFEGNTDAGQSAISSIAVDDPIGPTDDLVNSVKRVRRPYTCDDNSSQKTPPANTRQREKITDDDQLASNSKAVVEPIEQTEDIWCTCCKYITGTMIQCDDPNCKIEWFHIGCVGMEEKDIPKGNWFCPMCDKKSA